ncbi:hypothetical protein MMC32_001669 [Xylographa parallela]|nr:hypothetical protein [Xylographa parallela]
MKAIDASAGQTASTIFSHEAVAEAGAALAVVVAMAVAEADVIEAAPVVEDIAGLPDEVLDTIAMDIDEDDTAAPVAAGVEAAELTPLILSVTPTLPHNC